MQNDDVILQKENRHFGGLKSEMNARASRGHIYLLFKPLYSIPIICYFKKCEHRHEVCARINLREEKMKKWAFAILAIIIMVAGCVALFFLVYHDCDNLLAIMGVPLVFFIASFVTAYMAVLEKQKEDTYFG